ncbi:MAG: hypothetical protein HOM69_16250 [Gammaproteobacteria bacterium]|jgi:hypothetical protein|nr:hypothetical protein [Gammaproteobacteria bacterium]MBT5054781.1 hypothetical protein [Gammaproteobacteria bacterium]
MRLVFFFLIFILGFKQAVQADEPSTQTLAWPDGTRYVGGLQDQMRQGQGTIYWQDGTRFVGTFKDNLRHGPGMMILPDGTTYEGDFDRGRLIKPETESAPTLNPDTEPLTLAALNNDTISAITNTLDLWAAAWMAQNPDQYLSLYSDNFELAEGQSRNLWEMNRRERILIPSYIQLDLSYESFTPITPNKVDVKLRQSYRSDRYREISNKVLTLQSEPKGWRIIGERQR